METLSKIELDILYSLVLEKMDRLQKIAYTSTPQFKQALEIEQKKNSILISKLSNLIEGAK